MLLPPGLFIPHNKSKASALAGDLIRIGSLKYRSCKRGQAPACANDDGQMAE
jgi:hypothetical protein